MCLFIKCWGTTLDTIPFYFRRESYTIVFIPPSCFVHNNWFLSLQWPFILFLMSHAGDIYGWVLMMQDLTWEPFVQWRREIYGLVVQVEQ